MRSKPPAASPCRPARRRRRKRVGRRIERLARPPRRGVPHFDRAGIASRKQPPAVRREDDALEIFPAVQGPGRPSRRLVERRKPSRPPDASRTPSGDHASVSMRGPMAVERVNDLPAAASQTLTVCRSWRGHHEGRPAGTPRPTRRPDGLRAPGRLRGPRRRTAGRRRRVGRLYGGPSPLPPGSAGRRDAGSRKRRR